jgi:hypothetical protein
MTLPSPKSIQEVLNRIPENLESIKGINRAKLLDAYRWGYNMSLTEWRYPSGVEEAEKTDSKAAHSERADPTGNVAGRLERFRGNVASAGRLVLEAESLLRTADRKLRVAFSNLDEVNTEKRDTYPRPDYHYKRLATGAEVEASIKAKVEREERGEGWGLE